MRVAQVVLGVVEEARVEGLELEARERAGKLVGQELGVDAMPDALAVLDHLRKGPALLLAAPSQLEIRSLCVADLGDDHDFLAP